jgi:hypothetical protein
LTPGPQLFIDALVGADAPKEAATRPDAPTRRWQMLGKQDLEFVDCPECGFPAFVQHRFWVHSTHGDVTHLVTLCAQLHRLCMEEQPAPAHPEQPGVPLPTSTADVDCFVAPPSTHDESGAHDNGTGTS